MNKMYIYTFANDKYPDESVVGLTSSLKELTSQLNAGGNTWRAICRFETYEQHSINDFNYVFCLMGKVNKKKYPANAFGVDMPGERTLQIFDKISEGTNTVLRFDLVDENGLPLSEAQMKMQ